MSTYLNNKYVELVEGHELRANVLNVRTKPKLLRLCVHQQVTQHTRTAVVDQSSWYWGHHIHPVEHLEVFFPLQNRFHQFFWTKYPQWQWYMCFCGTCCWIRPCGFLGAWSACGVHRGASGTASSNSNLIFLLRTVLWAECAGITYASAPVALMCLQCSFSRMQLLSRVTFELLIIIQYLPQILLN